MSRLFKKGGILAGKLKKMDREIMFLDREIKSLSRYLNKAGNEGQPVSGEEGHSDEDTARMSGKAEIKMKDRDSRFASYLVSGLSDIRPLKHERTALRNKALFMLVLVVALALWLFYRYKTL